MSNKTMSREEYQDYLQKRKKKSKYGNKKVVFGGIEFDSKLERDRYIQLRHMESIGKIKDLLLQPKFQLQPKFRDAKNVMHREINYTGDFYYVVKETGDEVVEDAKGYKTQVYKMKRKMFMYSYPYITFKEVKR